MFFSEGNEVTLEAVLANRDKREAFIQHYLSDHRYHTVVSMKCNIPGPIKNNQAITQYFDESLKTFVDMCAVEKIALLDTYGWNEVTGPEAFLIFNENPLDVKKVAVMCEEKNTGRMLDIDVTFFDRKTNDFITVKREAVGSPVRKCLICENDAKICSSRRVHAVEDLQEKIASMLTK